MNVCTKAGGSTDRKSLYQLYISAVPLLHLKTKVMKQELFSNFWHLNNSEEFSPGSHSSSAAAPARRSDLFDELALWQGVFAPFSCFVNQACTLTDAEHIMAISECWHGRKGRPSRWNSTMQMAKVGKSNASCCFQHLLLHFNAYYGSQACIAPRGRVCVRACVIWYESVWYYCMWNISSRRRLNSL